MSNSIRTTVAFLAGVMVFAGGIAYAQNAPTADKVDSTGGGTQVQPVVVKESAQPNPQTASIKVQPSTIEERVDPGQVLNKTLTITNFSSVSQTYYLTVRNVSDVTSAGEPIFAVAGEATPYDVLNWITFAEKQIYVTAGEEHKLNFTITIPKDVSPGGHYGGVFVSLNPPEPKQSGTGVGFQVGTLLNLRVSGEVLQKAVITEFVTDKSIYGDSKVTFTTKIENLGNVLIRPRGPIDIRNTFDQKVTTVRMNDTAGAVFPKGIRDFSVKWEDETFHFGRYTAIMTLAYGDDGNPENVTRITTFWVLPTKIIVPALVSLLVVILIIWLSLRLYVSKRLKEVAQYGRGGRPSGTSRLAVITISLLITVIVLFALLFFYFG